MFCITALESEINCFINKSEWANELKDFDNIETFVLQLESRKGIIEAMCINGKVTEKQ
jgi:hypothetical protein